MSCHIMSYHIAGASIAGEAQDTAWQGTDPRAGLGRNAGALHSRPNRQPGSQVRGTLQRRGVSGQ